MPDLEEFKVVDCTTPSASRRSNFPPVRDGSSATYYCHLPLLIVVLVPVACISSTSEFTHSMSGEEEEGKKKKPATTVKIIETVFVEAGTAEDFKSVVQRLTGRGSAAAAAPEQDQAGDRRAAAGTGRGGSSGSTGGRKASGHSDAKRSG
ncbi:uncharacterized protein LOC106866026 [Brachypodium distachyon]|nr:uncharacterized protein LOC106866026 [Brachypodium distachyon]|eukprot:XP_014754012.1 uncharacterized protein LOC106866026 [Brachypodium distachyon]